MNYFTLYGPAMFISSLVVGAFLGWVWAVKIPAVVADLEPTPPTAVPTTNPESQTDDDPAALRAVLLGDLDNVTLRKRYLAVRTPFQRNLDGGLGQ